MRLPLLVVVLALLLVARGEEARASGGQPGGEGAALVEIFRSTGGPQWKHRDGWTTDAAEAEDAPWCNGAWFGVECDAERRVDYLGLQGNNLRGTVPEAMCNLTALTRLYLWRNRLAGTLPPCLGAPGAQDRLAFVDLHENQLEGKLPKHVIASRVATHVILERNNFEGPVPWDDGAQPSATYEHLWLADNPRVDRASLPPALRRLRPFDRRLRGDESAAGEL